MAFRTNSYQQLSVLYSSNASRPNTPVNVCIGALIIKELFGISDDEVVENLMLDPRYQYHLILIAVKQEPEIICQLVETIRKMVITPVIVLLPDHSEMRNKIIQSGADVVLTQLCIEEISLQAYALIRRYTEWKSERKEEIPVMVGKLEIFPLQRTVEWEHKRIPVVKREFDFLYLLASTPGRVYTYSQIYQLVWQEYPHGDITNIIYCMVHRLKRKLKNVDVNAEHIIISVKEVGYCLKI